MAKVAKSALVEPTNPAISGSDVSLSYDEQKTLAGNTDPAVRRELAEQRDVRPEILYYLAKDVVPAVRRAIAENKRTPVKADLILANDKDEESRCLLAEKISRLAPDLNPEQQAGPVNLPWRCSMFWRATSSPGSGRSLRKNSRIAKTFH